MPEHKHKAIMAKRQMYGWTECVNPDYCATHGENAHGGVVFVDACTCGATRKHEGNGTARVYGPWIEKEEPAHA